MQSKHVLIGISAVVLAFAVLFGIRALTPTVYGAPISRTDRTILPETTDVYELGTSSKEWLRAHVQTLCLNGDCQSAWPSSSFSTTAASYFSSVGLAFSTTSSDYWKTQNNFFSTTSAAYHIGTFDKGYFFSTTSALAHLTLIDKGFFFSTTSSNFWASAGLGHSTTSVAYQLTQNVVLGNATSTNFFATLASSTSLFANNATTTTLGVTGIASTSALTVSGVRSALGLFSSAGVLSAYAGGSCTSNQFLTAITATGGCTSSAVTDSFISGQIGLSHGGTNASLSGANQVLFLNSGNTAVTSNSNFIFSSPLNALAIGTTTPNYPLVIASSTAPQLALSSGTSTAFNWALRAMQDGSFALATSTGGFGNATSSKSVLAINSSGKITLPGLTSCDTIDTDSTGQLACGTDSVGSASWPFTPTTYNSQLANSTSTLLWLTNSTLSLVASSTQFVNATTTTLFATHASTTNATTTKSFSSYASSTDFWAVRATSTWLRVDNIFQTPLAYFNLLRNGIGSTTPSTLWLNSLASSTVLQNGQFAITIASSTANLPTVVIDWSGTSTAMSSNQFRYILQQNINVVLNSTSSHPIDGAKYILDFCQDGTGSRTVTFITPEALVWMIPGGTTTVNSAANTMTSIGMTYDGRVSRYIMRALATSSDIRACKP